MKRILFTKRFRCINRGEEKRLKNQFETTCAIPRPKTFRRIDFSLGNENSSPMENIRKTMPNSANVCVA